MQVYVNEDEKRTLTRDNLPELGDATLEVRVFSWDERKEIVAKFIEAASDSGASDLGAGLDEILNQIRTGLEAVFDESGMAKRVNYVVRAEIEKWLKASGAGISERQSRLAQETQNDLPRKAICGWSGVKNSRGGEVAFDPALVGKLEPFDAIADIVIETALPGFKQSGGTAAAAAELAAEGTDQKN